MELQDYHFVTRLARQLRPEERDQQDYHYVTRLARQPRPGERDQQDYHYITWLARQPRPGERDQQNYQLGDNWGVDPPQAPPKFFDTLLMSLGVCV